MAFGGVDTGSNNAVDEDRAMIMAISHCEVKRIAIPSGTSTVLIAVLLMKLENNIVAKAKMI